MAEAEDEEYKKCGLFCFTPDWLQKLKTPVCALLAIAMAGFVQGAIVNGLLHLVISTIERRFNLRSVKSGLVSGGYDIASLICLIPVTYLGGRPNASKPRWIGVGAIVMGIGSLIFSLPHFLQPTSYTHYNNENGKTLCKERVYSSKGCVNAETKLSNYMWVFLIGNLFHGAGASPLYTLGITFIDESVVKKSSALFMGVFYTGSTLGVATGYVVGGSFLQMNEEFLSEIRHTANVSPSSNTWIGAWWLGFLIFGAFSILISIPILCIPAKLPGWEEAKMSRLSEAIVSSERTKAFSSLRELPAAMVELLKNTSLVLLSFAGCCEGIVLSGSGAFIPKIIQSQFHLSNRTTSLVMGIITVPSAVLGTLVGGGILRKYELRFVGILKLCICTACLSMICATCFLITCSDEMIVGLNVPYYIDRKDIKLEDLCNGKCGCSTKEFMPVCGVNNLTYYSPCYAGCRQSHISSLSDVTLYSECSCIEEHLDDGIQASSQACKTSCPYLPIFLILMYLSLFFTFVAAMPALTATLRCVGADQRSLALGIQWMLVRLLGMIPGPLLFGVILDETCLYWQAPPCTDEKGSCVLYDHYMISWSMVLLAVGWKSLEIILFMSSIYFYKKSRNN